MSPSSNQTFSFARFGRLFGRHTAEHLRGYLMTAAVGAGGMLLVLGFVTYLQRSALTPTGQSVFFTVFLLGGGSIFASTVFAQVGERRRATVALLLPASHLEKYLVAWIYSLPLFLAVFIPLFYLADAAVAYAGAAPGQQPELLNVFADLKQANRLFWALAVLHGAWLWGAIYFEKTHFIKTGFAVFILVGVLWTLNFQALKLLISPQLSVAPPFVDLTLAEGKEFYTLGVPDGQLAWLGLVPVALAGLLWLAAYHRLTEKQL
ncbi:hypothetical protein [Hymenobacter sp.]|uniref:hypothetical protein n=1 Tax=Hymenobacter sp. TaxID=1898978 RepID=UPI00286A70D7|nr:hypothetical protein [Hymenobacter sp.]